VSLDLIAGREAGILPDDPRPSWPYIWFGDFRRKLAAHIGISLDEMRGFGGDRDWDAVTSPLRHPLDHPDNEGELSPQQAAELAPALQQALFALAKDANYGPAYSYDMEHGRALVDLLARCASENIPVLFC